MTVGILGHGVQGRLRRHPVEPGLQAASGSCGSRRARCSAPTRYVTDGRPDAPAARGGARRADLLIIATPHAEYRDLDDRQAGRRHLEPAGQRSARVIDAARPRLDRHPVYNEGERDRPGLDAHPRGGARSPCEVLVVVDIADDTTVPCVEKLRRRRARGAGRDQHLRARAGQRDPVRHRPRRGAPSWWSPWPTAATTRARSTTWPGWSSAAWSWPRRRATCPAASRSAARASRRFLSRTARAHRCTAFARVGTRDATNSFKAYDTASSARSASTAATASRSASS